MGGIDDIFCRCCAGVLLLVSDMLRRGPVTFFAIHAVHDLPAIELFRLRIGRGSLQEVRAVTFQTTCRDRPVKYRLVGVTRAVGPLTGRCEISDGQLEQAIVRPGQEGLSLGARSDHDVETSFPFLLAPDIFHLVVCAVVLLHDHFYGIIKGEAVRPRIQAAFYIFSECFAGGEIVRCVEMGFSDLFMAARAACRACELAEIFSGGLPGVLVRCPRTILVFSVDAPGQQGYAGNDDEDR